MNTKITRALCAALIIVMIVTFSGCGFLAGEPVTYSNGTGLSIVMPAGMESFSADGFAMAYHSDDVMMSAVKENFSDYAELELNLEAMSIEEYSLLTQEINGLENAFAADTAGNLFVTYEAHIDGQNYIYYSTVRKGSDAFWVVTFACPEKHGEEYLSAFEKWSASIVVQ